MDYEIKDVVEEGKEPRVRKDRSYLEVFSLFGKYPRNWERNRTQIDSAKNVIEELGIELAGKVIRWYEKHKEEPFCPQILSPYDLDTKYLKIKVYRDKQL